MEQEIIDVPSSSAAELESMRRLTHILYGLHTLAWFSGGTFAVIAVIINYIKRGDAPNALIRGHHDYQIRTFWWTVAWLVITAPLWLLFIAPGWVAYSVIFLWYLYRFLKGWWRFAENKPV